MLIVYIIINNVCNIWEEEIRLKYNNVYIITYTIYIYYFKLIPSSLELNILRFELEHYYLHPELHMLYILEFIYS